MTGLRVRGISYTSGVHPPEVVEEVMRAIREDLHCTSVMLIDSDNETLIEAAQIALAAGLDVVVRPYLPNARRPAVLAHLRATALAAERLRAANPGRVTLLVGTEFSLTSRGIVPGPHEFIRLALILRSRRFLRRRIARRLDAMLTEAAAVARSCFQGPVSYGAGHWEQVDWTRFDFVGVNLYRFGDDAERYRRQVRELVAASGKPVVITEFGCGAHVGGHRRGPGSFRIVRWFADPPRIKEGNVRDEGVQAAYLAELIDVYHSEGAYGCFVFTFLLTDFPHREDPRFDLDMAGFGIVKVPAGDPVDWAPKEAFGAVARRYGMIASGT